MTDFVFDTYALLEIIRGNPNYAPYTEATPFLNLFVLAELCWKLSLEHGKGVADRYTEKYAPGVCPLEAEDVKDAVQFRLTHRKKNMSFTDYVSYAQAKKMG